MFRSWKTSLVALILSVLLVGIWLVRLAAVTGPAPVPEDAWPAADATGLPLIAVYQGRLPCSLPDCDQVATLLALYGREAPVSFWLARVFGDGADQRSTVTGPLSLSTGIPLNPEAPVLTLGAGAPENLRRLWQVGDEILLPLDAALKPVPGTADWGRMLSRTR
jgi:hypothetical protein